MVIVSQIKSPAVTGKRGYSYTLDPPPGFARSVSNSPAPTRATMGQFWLSQVAAFAPGSCGADLVIGIVKIPDSSKLAIYGNPFGFHQVD